MKTKHIATLLICIVSITLQAQNALQNFLNEPALRHANISFLLQDSQTGKAISQHNPNTLATPASVTKLFTTATALELYGGDYRFTTTLETDGTLLPDGTLQGNLYIVGSGDPTMGSFKHGDRSFIFTWLKKIKQHGIKKIEGKVIADISFFDPEAINAQWIWEDIGNYYAPGISALSYMDNTLHIQLQSGPIGTTPKITKVTPEIDGLEFENHLKCTHVTFDSAYVHGIPLHNKRFLFGAIPSNKGVFGLKGDIPNPALLLAQHFTQLLREASVNVTQEADYTFRRDTTREVIYTHYSPCLRDIVWEINQKSNNHYAEHLFRHLGSQMGIPASANHSIATIKSYWRTRIWDDTYFIADGSGLSPLNAISATTFVRLIHYMTQQSTHKEDFLYSLPTAGKSGTLTSFLKGTYLEGHLQAKSGTTRRIKSYGGIIRTPEGKNYTFAIIVNNATCSPRNLQYLIQKLLKDVCSENR